MSLFMHFFAVSLLFGLPAVLGGIFTHMVCGQFWYGAVIGGSAPITFAPAGWLLRRIFSGWLTKAMERFWGWLTKAMERFWELLESYWRFFGFY